MKKEKDSHKFIYHLCEIFLKNDCDTSKGHYTKKTSTQLHKDEDGNFVACDPEYSLNVIFETDVLHHVLSSSKLKNIDNLNDRVISISDCNIELFSYNNSKSSITTKLVLHIKKFDLAGGNEKANGTPRNINYDPKIFFMIQEFFHRSYKKSSKPTKKVASLDADAIINKSFSGKFDSIRKTYDEKSGVNIGNNKKNRRWPSKPNSFNFRKQEL